MLSKYGAAEKIECRGDCDGEATNPKSMLLCCLAGIRGNRLPVSNLMRQLFKELLDNMVGLWSCQDFKIEDDQRSPHEIGLYVIVIESLRLFRLL